MRHQKVLGWCELIVGVLLTILGVYTFVNPSPALTGVVIVYGVFAVITGIADIIYYVQLEKRTGFGPAASLVGGILGIIAGILLLLNIWAASLALMILFPIWFIAHCIARLAHLPYIRMISGTAYYYFTMVFNILGLIVGILMIFNPFITFVSAAYLIGVYLLLLGIDSIVFAVTLLNG